jgi:hypothetical protein
MCNRVNTLIRPSSVLWPPWAPLELIRAHFWALGAFTALFELLPFWDPSWGPLGPFLGPPCALVGPVKTVTPLTVWPHQYIFLTTFEIVNHYQVKLC